MYDDFPLLFSCLFLLVLIPLDLIIVTLAHLNWIGSLKVLV